MRFAKESLPFVVPPALASIALYAFALPIWGSLALLLAALILLFFRVPSFVVPSDGTLVVAPAYGKVTRVDRITEPAGGAEPVARIVTFLSVFDVHVQRCPVGGRVEVREFVSGRKVAAFREDAAELNESDLTVIQTDEGIAVGVRQVVGLIARRIVCYLREGDAVERGAPLGLIRFGSRVDLTVPADWEILVRPGDRVRAGETPVARCGPAPTGSQ